jgi:uncharacterized protein (DUF1684 family)
MVDLTTWRQRKDELFRSPDSPLTLDQRPSFSGLKYWPEDPTWRFRLPLDSNVEPGFVMMPTSTGSQQRYERAGTITVNHNGAASTLTLYTDEHGLFLPFRDGTSDDESYGAGRYLEPTRGDDGLIEVDFNFAYNPYCAYNEHYSCPIPPAENRTTMRIEAGEKKFKD